MMLMIFASQRLQKFRQMFSGTSRSCYCCPLVWHPYHLIRNHSQLPLTQCTLMSKLNITSWTHRIENTCTYLITKRCSEFNNFTLIFVDLVGLGLNASWMREVPPLDTNETFGCFDNSCNVSTKMLHFLGQFTSLHWAHQWSQLQPGKII